MDLSASELFLVVWAIIATGAAAYYNSTARYYLTVIKAVVLAVENGKAADIKIIREGDES